MDLVAGAGRAEAAIGPGDNPLAPNHLRKASNSLRHEFGMFDQMNTVRHDAGDENLVLGQGRVLPHLPLVLMARICRLDNVSAGADPEHEIDKVLELKIE